MSYDDLDDRGRPLNRSSGFSSGGATGGGSSSYDNGGGQDERRGGGGGYRESRSGFGGERSGGYGGSRGPMTCYNCQGEGHKSADCPESRQERSGGGGGYQRRDDRYGGGSYDDRPRPTHCFNCQGEGHKSFECPEPQREGGGRRDGGGYRGGERREYQPAGRRDGGGYGGDRPTKCYNCQGEGHKSMDCPEPRQERQGGGGDRDRRSGGGYDRRGGGGYDRPRREPLDAHLDELKIDDPSRPRLQLARRGAPAASAGSSGSVVVPPVADVYAKKGASSIFGEAKPRELNLIAAGKEIRPESPPRRRSSVDAGAAAAASAAN